MTDKADQTDQTDQTDKKSKRGRSFGGVLERQMMDTVTNEVTTQYLLVKGRMTGIWSFPKGHSKKTETPYECAIREIREETGLQITDQPRRVLRMKGGIYFVFDMKYQTEQGKPEEQEKPEDVNEIEETRWVTRKEMEYLIVNSGVKHFLEKRAFV
jgi:8-oxo-dGTP pyrophosphatase MutT (NUDIX family)